MILTTNTDGIDPPQIAVHNVWKSFERGRIEVLRGVSLTTARGEVAALCGPSGCGKSTLLHLIGGLEPPDDGRIFIEGRSFTTEKERLALLRHKIGFVFQLHNLIPDLTLAENCLIPAVAAGVPRREAMDRLRELADRTGLTARLSFRMQKLSGGERQRTALCRALMNRPAIVLADEPTGALDDKAREQVFDLLQSLVRQEQVTLLMATHDRGLAEQCDRLFVVNQGRIFESTGVF